MKIKASIKKHNLSNEIDTTINFTKYESVNKLGADSTQEKYLIDFSMHKLDIVI